MDIRNEEMTLGKGEREAFETVRRTAAYVAAYMPADSDRHADATALADMLAAFRKGWPSAFGEADE